MTRSRMRFVNMSLGDDEGKVPLYTAECAQCPEKSEPHEESESPELWCLMHAGRTHHLEFRGTVTNFFKVTPEEALE
ncbi:hypothetical protein [Streptomyces pseudovenezuelae]|uniref:DUF7848 domain-containing protein n=1 Tax=Streptomyces pseudovenezuelae TaxID=67350 RepID=A0ABT6LLB9_9ACTN|nr:hypothetical protein [Streptomyces pseudovenezuelae]MDH6217088.1 hypothetical protein [Streptomyces pseudovenezuelae]